MKHHLPLVFQIASLLTVAGVAGTSCGFDDLAGRDSGEGSFVFLQLFQYPSGELELMYFRSGKYPVRDVAISWEDETKQSASHPTTPEASYELGTQTTTMFRLGNVGLAVTESVGRPLATIPVPTNATTQDFVARIADLHGARQQHFSLRRVGKRWAIASMLRGRQRYTILYRCIPRDFPEQRPSAWPDLKEFSVVIEGCLDGQEPRIEKLQ